MNPILLSVMLAVIVYDIYIVYKRQYVRILICQIKMLPMTHRGQVDMGRLLITFIIVILGLSLTPQVAETVTSTLPNLTGISASIYPLVTVLWVFLILSIPASEVYRMYKAIG